MSETPKDRISLHTVSKDKMIGTDGNGNFFTAEKTPEGETLRVSLSGKPGCTPDPELAAVLLQREQPFSLANTVTNALANLSLTPGAGAGSAAYEFTAAPNFIANLCNNTEPDKGR